MTGSKLDRKALRFPRTVIEPVLHGIEVQSSAHSLDELIGVLGVSREQFADASFSIDGEQMVALFRWLRERADVQLGIRQILSQFSATSAGLAGMAALSARNVRESLLVAVRYLPLLIPAMRADLVEDRRYVRFKLTMITDLGEMDRFLMEWVTAAINIISLDVMSQPIQRTIHFEHGYGKSERAARHIRDLQDFVRCPIVFNSTFNGMQGNTVDLDVPTRSPNDATFSTVKRILEDEMSARMQPHLFSDTVRHEMVRLVNQGHHLSLEAFAERLNLAPRTLVRKLASEQTSFKQLANEVRFRLAIELLERTSFSVKQIAVRAGFMNANSFSRAFKAQYGETPLSWRQARRD